MNGSSFELRLIMTYEPGEIIRLPTFTGVIVSKLVAESYNLVLETSTEFRLFNPFKEP